MPAFKRNRDRNQSGKLTPDVQTKIIQALKTGAYIEGAAAYANVTKQSIYNWLRRGSEEKSGKYKDFMIAVESALDAAELIHLNNLNNQSKGDWRASAWVLERKYPKRWGKREIVKIEDNDTKGGAFEDESLNAVVARELDKIDDGRWED